MKNVIIALLVLGLAQIAVAQTNDSQGVMRLIEGFRMTLSKGDARGFADLFAEDADFTNVLDQSMHGRETIYQHHIGVFKGRPKSRTNNVLSFKMRFLTPEIAALEIKWDNKHSIEADGTKRPDRDGVWVAVATKEKGTWYFKIVRNVMLNDGTKPPQSSR